MDPKEYLGVDLNSLNPEQRAYAKEILKIAQRAEEDARKRNEDFDQFKQEIESKIREGIDNHVKLVKSYRQYKERR